MLHFVEDKKGKYIPVIIIIGPIAESIINNESSINGVWLWMLQIDEEPCQHMLHLTLKPIKICSINSIKMQ